MYCKMACQIFSSTFTQKIFFHTFPNTVFVKKLPKKSILQKITTIKNYVQVDPITSTAVKNGGIDFHIEFHSNRMFRLVKITISVHMVYTDHSCTQTVNLFK